MPLLSRPLQLHDVLDVESLMWKAIDASPNVDRLQPHDREDLCAFLLGMAWELSLVYNPSRGQVTFSTFVYRTARLRVIDWQRSRYGRTRWQFSGYTYERERPQPVSLEDNPEHRRLVESLGRERMDDGSSGLPDHLRTLAARGRRPGRCDYYLGDEAA